MITEDIHVSDIVRDNPALSRVFEEAGINYCCGGNRPLSEACRERGLDSKTLVTVLNSLSGKHAGAPDSAEENPDALTSRELVAHIVEEHHGYLRRELPRLDYLTQKVAADHGDQDPRLREIALLFGSLVADLLAHQEAEERKVFPALVESDGLGEGETGIGSVLESLMEEHAGVAEALTRLRELTDDYTPAEWACNTTRAMVHGLRELEADLHRHIHKENNVLFLRYLKPTTARP
ncbi:MAG: iron-sulfur cluster repair di-iron protein [Spirochaetota bacterium]